MEKQTYNNLKIRKLTPREVFRLMDVDDGSIDKILNARDGKGKPVIAKTQAYKMAGNSIVTSVIQSILYKLFVDTKTDTPQQLTLF